MKIGIGSVLLLMMVQIALVHAETDSITIKPYFPDYLEEEASTAIFSGQDVVISGKLPKDETPILRMHGTGGIERTLVVRQSPDGSIISELPYRLLTGNYNIIAQFKQVSFVVSVFINGLSQEQLDQLEQGEGGGGALEEEPVLSSAILYHSEVPCGRCYWESVLDGHPTDDRHLFFAGGRLTPYYTLLSHDGGRTWEVNRHSYPELFLQNDPDSIITPNGQVYLVGLKWTNDLQDSAVKTCALLTGDIERFPTGETLLAQLPANIPRPLGNRLVCDFPKIAYNYNTGNLFILLRIVVIGFTNEGYQRNNLLLVSTKDENTFMTYRIPEPFAVTIFSSIDTDSNGQLFASTIFSQMGVTNYVIVRISENTGNLEILGGVPQRVFEDGARIAAGDPDNFRVWYVGIDPIIAIDRSAKHKDRMYMVWSEAQERVFHIINQQQHAYWGYNFDVFLSYSDDKGTTWSPPIKINDDNSWADQGMVSVDLDSEGVVNIAFIDKRENPGSPFYDIYYAKFVDGKVSQNIRVNREHIPNLVGGVEPGDYLDMIEAYPNNVYISYPCGGSGELPSGMCFTALDPNLVPFRGEFIRGDSNHDLGVDISDVIKTLQYLFSGGSVKCQDAADVNDDGKIDLSDPIVLLNYLFSGGPQPREPFPEPGPDQSNDDMLC